MKKSILICIIFSICITLTGCMNTDETINDDFKIIDVYNREVYIPKDASTFVCIGPNALRLYTYIADPNHIVGIENFELLQQTKGRPYILKYQDIIDQLPIIGEGGPKASPNAELILSANPDVIIASSLYEKSVIDALYQTLNIPIVTITNDTSEGSLFSEDLMKSLENIGIITGNTERATQLIEYINSIKADLNQRTKELNHKKTAYIGSLSKAGHQQITSTSGSYEIFDLVNVINIAHTKGINQYANIEKETLLSWNPEIIILDLNGYDLFLTDYQTHQTYYEHLNAFQNNEVYMQFPYNFYSTNIEVAIANCYHLGSVLYPDEFSDIDISVKVNDIGQTFLNIDIYESLNNDYHQGYQTELPK